MGHIKPDGSYINLAPGMVGDSLAKLGAIPSGIRAEMLRNVEGKVGL